MKSEPAITYNHIDEDGYQPYTAEQSEKKFLPVSLYLILIVDVVLMGVLIFFTVRTIF